jgi:hypothetical protein
LPSIDNVLLPDGTGAFDVSYASGSPSRIHYQNVESAFDNVM